MQTLTRVLCEPPPLLERKLIKVLDWTRESLMSAAAAAAEREVNVTHLDSCRGHVFFLALAGAGTQGTFAQFQRGWLKSPLE